MKMLFLVAAAVMASAMAAEEPKEPNIPEACKSTQCYILSIESLKELYDKAYAAGLSARLCSKTTREI